MPTEPKIYQVRIKDLQILSLKIEDEPTDYAVGSVFNFDISTGHFADRTNGMIHVAVGVSIYEPERASAILSKVQVAAVYELPDFNEAVPAEAKDIPDDLRTLLHGITLSTTRGIMYSSLRGTYLQKAILPIINPQTMVLADQAPKQ